MAERKRNKVKTPKHLSREARLYINISTYVTTGNREGFDAKTIPIIAMTAKAFDDDRKQSKEAGINAHISKPIEISNLINTIDRLCNNATNSTEVTL